MKKKSALVIVDVQYDFLPGGNLEVPDGDKVIPKIKELIPQFETIIFTRDYHPVNHRSFASQHKEKRPFDILDLYWGKQVLWPDHCVQGTRGSHIHDDLIGDPKLKNKSVYIFKKGLDPLIDSYSGFYDNGRTNSTGLSKFLKEMRIKSLYIVGLARDYCVAWTAMDSVDEGFKTFVILEATKSIDPNWSLENLTSNKIIIK